MLGVAAPIEESPASRTTNVLLLSAALFLGLGILAAFFAANIIAEPFQKIGEQNAKLEELKETAENASRAKSDFLSNMSHEMRTPMNAIIGMTSIAKTSSDIERKNYCLNKIEDASTHLLGVINDILDMSKIEANKFELSSVRFNFEKMLQKVVNVINFRVEQRQQKFVVRLDRNIPRMLQGDDQRLAQVIANLLSNAVKFTPEQGSIYLITRLEKEENGLCTIQIEVRDSGIGISKEQQARLFTSFSQADTSISRKFGGTGLGLAISKRIVEMMNGKIHLESEEGKGSTFTITVQAARAEDDAQPSPGRNWSTIRVLAVDDDPEALEYFSEIARNLGFFCDTAAGGEEAWAMIEGGGDYNVYFIDWKMPGMNGIEISRRIKEKSRADAPSPVIIMVSATEWTVIEKEAKSAGVDKFLPKPFFPSSIADYINEYLGTQSFVDSVQANAQSADAGCFAGYTLLLAEDVKINQEIVLALLEPTLLKIECADNGKQALELFSENPGRYDMIFMDVQMPEMDGYETTRRIRALEDPAAARRVPIIAMTANVFREDIEKCLASGMDDHVGKPINMDEVMHKLNVYLPVKQKTELN
ncbi:MAG: response regulator [Spirochaetales bacterium]|nr:response regulator [Spirochaetales bacterium]